MPPIPPAPEGWNLTVDDLSAEMMAGKRKSMGSPEVEWALEYERSLLPPGFRFPKQGDTYEALEPVSVSYLTSWRTPYTGGDKGILQQGERVHIPQTPGDPRPVSVYAVPVDYKALEKRFVPFLTRLNPLYRDYYLAIKSVELARKFRLVS